MVIIRRKLLSPELDQLQWNIIAALITELGTELTLRTNSKKYDCRFGGGEP
jgi:hypothetical protein